MLEREKARRFEFVGGEFEGEFENSVIARENIEGDFFKIVS